MLRRRLVIADAKPKAPSNDVWFEVCYFYRKLIKAVDTATGYLADKVAMKKRPLLPANELALKRVLSQLIYINNPITEPPLVRRVGPNFFYYAPRDEIVKYAIIPFYTYTYELKLTRDLPEEHFSGRLSNPSEVESELTSTLSQHVEGFTGFYKQWATD